MTIDAILRIQSHLFACALKYKKKSIGQKETEKIRTDDSFAHVTFILSSFNSIFPSLFSVVTLLKCSCGERTFGYSDRSFLSKIYIYALSSNT